MADGFKKYFNGNTLAGRANVAKATYATLALAYLFYRVRRGKSQPPEEEKEPEPVKEPTGSCDDRPCGATRRRCDEPGIEGPDPDCTVCRERSRRSNRDEGCNGHDEPPPPPPPPANGGASTQRRKCPCEDPHRHVEVSRQNIQQQQQKVHSNTAQVDEAHPARELISQMQEAAGRVLRNVIGAVIGDTPTSAPSTKAEIVSSEDNCICCKTDVSVSTDVLDDSDPMEEDGSDYSADSQLRQRRTAPRSCVPSNTSGDTDLAPELDQQQQSQAQSQTRYRCFDDDFGSEMFFEDYEE